MRLAVSLRSLVTALGAVVLAFGSPERLGAEPVTFVLDTAHNGLLEVRVHADDGVATASTIARPSLPGGEFNGDLVGVISPLLTINRLEYSFSGLDIDMVIGTAQIPINLTLSGFLAWTDLSRPEVTLGSSTDLVTGDLSDASYVGVLTTPFGSLPFDLDETSGSTTNTDFIGSASRNFRVYFDSLDELGIRDQNGIYMMDTRHTVPIGEIGGVAWTLDVMPRFDWSTNVRFPRQCADGIDNDSDGVIDYPADPGCADADDNSEQALALVCDDGVDNDGDGLIDVAQDPGCANGPQSLTENPACQDGINNDRQAGIDFDGGLSRWGTIIDDPDPYCTQPWIGRERSPTTSGCGFGPELAGLIPLLLAARSIRKRGPERH